MVVIAVERVTIVDDFILKSINEMLGLLTVYNEKVNGRGCEHLLRSSSIDDLDLRLVPTCLQRPADVRLRQ